MIDFYIKRVSAYSKSKETATVELINGLNIIQGRSDTGKTCIAKCIEFVFGGDFKHLKSPFKESSGYDVAEVVLNTAEGEISIKRRVGKNQVEVVAPNVEWIDDGVYTLKPTPKTAKKPKPYFNNIMMRLLGFDEEQQVTKNARYEKERMSWASLLRLFFIKESRIGLEEPTMEPQDNYEKTPFLASILMLLYGKDFGDMDAVTKREIAVARKAAIKTYIDKKIQHASERHKEIEESLKRYNGVNVEKEIDELVLSLNQTEQQITAAMKKSKDLLGQILEKEGKLAQYKVLLSRYQYLRSQYKADIQRLSFIVEGEHEVKQLPSVSVCPFCEGKMITRGKKTYVDASKAELSRILAQIDALSQTEDKVALDKKAIEDELELLRGEHSELETLIQSELQPKATALSQSIVTLKNYIRMTEELRIVSEYASSWEHDIDSVEHEEEAKQTPYQPKAFFDSDFQRIMTENAEAILKECGYHNFTAARFDIPSFDIEVNGERKASSHGKGYRSYLNTVVGLMFRKYLDDHSEHNPQLLIVDTPLLGLDEEIPEDAPDSMKAGLFTYFLNHAKGQMIVIENLDHIPHLSYVESGANVITFTKRRDEGRYGFLNDVY